MNTRKDRFFNVLLECAASHKPGEDVDINPWPEYLFTREKMHKCYAFTEFRPNDGRLDILIEIAAWLVYKRDCTTVFLAALEYVEKNLANLTAESIFQATELCFLECKDHKGVKQDIHSRWFPYTVCIMAYALWIAHEEQVPHCGTTSGTSEDSSQADNVESYRWRYTGATPFPDVVIKRHRRKDRLPGNNDPSQV